MTFRKTETLNGNIEYCTAGKGLPLVLLPGAGLSPIFNWQSTIERLSENYCVIAIALPGSGATIWHRDTIHKNDLTATVSACLKNERISGEISVVGYSAGAMVALASAQEFGIEIKRVLAIAPWQFSARQAFLFDLWQKILLVDKELLARLNVLLAFNVAGQLGMDTATLETAVQMTMNSGANEDFIKLLKCLETLQLDSDLSKITAEVTIVGFTHDNISPVEFAKKLSVEINHSKFVEVAGGHAGLWESSASVDSIIDEFLR